VRSLRLHAVGELRLHEEPDPEPQPGEVLVRIRGVGLCGSDRHWFLEGGIGDAVLREPLLRLAARYLVQAHAPSGRALDPVAHFHLSNGARVERLNWQGDVSAKGLQQSAGIMVNYLYRQGDIEANHEAYRDEGRVAASSAVRSLARG